MDEHKSLTLAAVKQILRNRGVGCVKVDGEYIVGLNNSQNPDEKYHTEFLDDALSTGLRMADEHMIKTEDNWPNWPYLPLKKKGRLHIGRVGTLISSNDGKFRVMLASMFSDLRKADCLTYDSVAELLHDGWTID